MPENEHTDSKKRTTQQNKAYWLFCSQLAEILNLSGLEMKKVLKPEIEIPWTRQSIHDFLWVPIQKAMYKKESTTELDKHGEIDKIHEVLMRHLGQKFGVEYLPFPSISSEEEQLKQE